MLYASFSVRHDKGDIFELEHNQNNKMTWGQRRLRSTWASTQSDQSLKKVWVINYPYIAQWRLWSVWTDTQADLSFRWALRSFCFGSILNYTEKNKACTTREIFILGRRQHAQRTRTHTHARARARARTHTHTHTLLNAMENASSVYICFNFKRASTK